MGDDKRSYYGTGFERPENTLQLRKSKSKKRALHDRFFEESPTKKAKPRTIKQVRRPFGAQPPPPEDSTNEDSSLMGLVNLKHPPGTFKLSFTQSSGDKTPSKLSTSLSPCSPSSSMSPVRHSMSNVSCNSPTTTYYNSLQLNPSGNGSPSFFESLQKTPLSIVAPKKRQKLTPAPLTSSPSWPNGQGTPTKAIFAGMVGGRGRIRLEDKFAAADDNNINDRGGNGGWHRNPCLDWSLKTRLTLVAAKPFGWNSTMLKSSEESSGISAFARCIDIDPVSRNKPGSSPQGSQLDTSLGAQFHQCCLYWQHPCLPSINFFPRDSSNLSFNSVSGLNGIRLEQKVLDCMLMEWIEAFRSLFQLVRTRQCPYFYICANQWTGLFCAAGTQGLDYLQVYITPSSKGFRDSLKNEGIEFAMPFYCPEEDKSQDINKSFEKDGESDDEGADKWLDEMGIAQDVSVSASVKNFPVSAAEEKSKSTLVSIAGTDTLAFFNFLINSKSFLVATAGPFAGLPPTLLSPIAFHGASLKTLKVKQSKVKSASGDMTYSIEVNGPILPHVIATMCPLLQNTVQDFTIQTGTLGSTVNLNLNSRNQSSTGTDAQANAFELQNLSDCGLKKSVLDLFCRPNCIATINDKIECRNNMFKWS